MELNNNELTIYTYIKSFIEENGYCPCYRDIQEHLKFKTTNTVTFYLRKLKEKGLVDYEDNSPRTIRLANHKVTLVPVP